MKKSNTQEQTKKNFNTNFIKNYKKFSREIQKGYY